jgi:MFS family permease
VLESYYQEVVIPESSASTISWIGAMQVFLLLASNVVAGPLQDKYGPKPLMLTFALLFCFSCMMVSLCKEWWQLFLAQGILQGTALSFGFAPPMACAIAWFKHKSPIAVAVIVSGSSVGGILWPIIVHALLVNVGFGWTWRAIGFIGLGLLSIATLLVSQPDMYAGDGKEEAGPTGNIVKRFFYRSSKNRPPPRAFFYWDAFKIPAFNSYVASICFIYLGLFYTFFYLPSWGVVYGMSQSLSFYSISILNAASFFGRLGLPFLSFKTGPFNVLLFCAAVSTILVYASIAVNSIAGVLIIGSFYGFFSGGLISMLAPCVASLVSDKTRIGSAVGQLAAVSSIPSLLGP